MKKNKLLISLMFSMFSILPLVNISTVYADWEEDEEVEEKEYKLTKITNEYLINSLEDISVNTIYLYNKEEKNELRFMIPLDSELLTAIMENKKATYTLVGTEITKINNIPVNEYNDWDDILNFIYFADYNEVEDYLEELYYAEDDDAEDETMQYVAHPEAKTEVLYNKSTQQKKFYGVIISLVLGGVRLRKYLKHNNKSTKSND